MKAMQGYMPAMLDIADQLVLKWGRLNRNELIDVPDDMTRLTLDTIGLCGSNYRFNSFYREQLQPFIQAMVRALGESMAQIHWLGVRDKLMLRAHHKFQQDISFMNGLVDTLIAERRATLAAAFSRVTGQPKTYLQHSILAHQDAVWALLEQGAVVSICGDGANMAPAVRAAFTQVYCEKTGASAEAAESWLDGLVASNRYLTDVWAAN